MANGLQGIALTDHDTVAGIPEFLGCSVGNGLHLLPGIELSSHYKESSLHLLGYGINHEDQELQDNLRRIQEARERRNQAIFARLQHMGLDLSPSEIQKPGDGPVGRPHIANLMVRKLLVKNEHEAFNKFLKKGARAYVAREKLPVQEAIAMIRRAGGLAVLAHPASADPTCIFMAQLIAELKGDGLRGIEVFHPMHNSKHVRFFSNLCRDLQLIATGGSDFHGRQNEHRSLGNYGKNKPISFDLWQDLENHL